MAWEMKKVRKMEIINVEIGEGEERWRGRRKW
jgi:hypothetical protein